MRRSAALTPLSHDHHQALYAAKVLGDSEEPEPATEAFAKFWEKYGAQHFRIEEEVLLPGLDLRALHRTTRWRECSTSTWTFAGGRG